MMMRLVQLLVLSPTVAAMNGNTGQGGGGGGGQGGGPPAPPTCPEEGQPLQGANAYNLDVEVYIFAEETEVAYGGTCADACAAVDLGDNGDSANACVAGCNYIPYTPFEAEVPPSCSNATITEEAQCVSPHTWNEGSTEVPEVAEACTQAVQVDCSAREVACPRGVCDAADCEDAVACAFTPDTVVVPPNAVKYNIGSSGWPFCGDNNFLSVVVEMTEGGGETDDGSTCTADDCVGSECTSEEEEAIEACAAVHGEPQAACEAAGCTYTAGTAAGDCSALTPDTTESPDQCAAGCVYTAPVAATCGTGNDAAGNACAVNSDGTASCAVATGACVYQAAVAEECADPTAEAEIDSTATLDVKFKGRSPNFDVCSSSDSCLNFKFGKIEERGPDAARKVNAHSIMSLASRNNLPTWSTGTTSYGNSNQVTWVKMELCGNFRRGCSANGRDGGAKDPNAMRDRPARRRAVLEVGDMVAQMPTQAMVSPFGTTDPQEVTNITVTRTPKGMEFVFPAFSEAYYDPVVATQDSYDACEACEAPTADEMLSEPEAEPEAKATSSSSVQLAAASSLAMVLMRTVV